MMLMMKMEKESADKSAEKLAESAEKAADFKFTHTDGIEIEVVNMCKAWDDHKKRGIQEGIQQGMQQGRCLEVYSLVQDGILEPEVGAKRVSMSLDDFADAMQKAGYKVPELV